MIRTRSISLTVLFALLPCAVIPAFGQDLLPLTFSGANSSSTEHFAAAKLDRLAGADATILREYGVFSAERRAYPLASGPATLVLYHVKDPTGAFGAYTFLRSAEMKEAGWTEFSVASRTRALALIGNLLLDVSAQDVGPLRNPLKTLVSDLGLRADLSPYPTLWRLLPSKGLVASSARLVVGPAGLNRFAALRPGDWIGFAQGAEVEMARYKLGGQELTLVLASFPTPQGAARKYQELRGLFQMVDGAPSDPGKPRVYGRRVRSLLALVVEGGTAEAARALLDQVQYEINLTWNEPGFKATEASFVQMLAGIFIGTGVILAFTFIAGLAFGAFRLFVKRLLPGKVFDRPEQLEIIQLGLSSKPIEAKDFY